MLIATVSRALVWLLALAVLHSNAAISAAMGRAGRVPLLLLLVWTLQTAGMVFNSVRISTSSMEHGYFYPEVRQALNHIFLCIPKNSALFPLHFNPFVMRYPLWQPARCTASGSKSHKPAV